MRKLIFAASLLLSFAFARAEAQTPSALTVIRAGSLIDGAADTARKNQLIFVRGARVEKIADAATQIPAIAAFFYSYVAVLIVTLGVNGFFALAASLAIGSALSYLAYSYLNGKGTWTSYET